MTNHSKLVRLSVTCAFALLFVNARIHLNAATQQQNNMDKIVDIEEEDVIETTPTVKKVLFDANKKHTLKNIQKLSKRQEQSRLQETKQEFNEEIKPETPQKITFSEPKPVLRKLTTPTAGNKPAITFKNGDSLFTIGVKAKIENYLIKNACLLNDAIPDDFEYFKHTVDLSFNFAYGKEKFGHNALESHLNFRHKGVWGRPQSFADRDSGSVEKTSIRIANSVTGAHSHSTGKSLPWMSEAWLKMSLNAALGLKTQNIHTVKLGWFPFVLGRGIALGDWYGTNRAIFGLYGYDKEDHYSPGINISGEIIKDILSYDLYYSKFEEHNKSLGDTIDLVRTRWVNSKPWRGAGKDSDLFAGRLKWNALNNTNYGKLEIEPYIMYNCNPDAYVEFEPDAHMYLGACGFSTEYSRNNFECGSDIAFNIGHENLVAYDRNDIVIKINKDTGALTEYYSHIVNNADNTLAIKSKVNDATFADLLTKKNGEASGAFKNRAITDPVMDPNSTNRFRPAYKNNLRGWMGVVDAAYNFKNYNVKVAATYGYASGDVNPHEEEKNKTHNGFIGLNECHAGKRVRSILVLDERLLKRPTSLTKNSDELSVDMAFTDLHMLGIGATWTPKINAKPVNLNPNMLFFFKAHDSQKLVYDTRSGTLDWWASDTEKARKFMGTELNIFAQYELIKDLNIFGKFATFIPGTYFSDMKGVLLDDDFFSLISKVQPSIDPQKYRMGTNSAFYLNLGLDYKF